MIRKVGIKSRLATELTHHGHRQLVTGPSRPQVARQRKGNSPCTGAARPRNPTTQRPWDPPAAGAPGEGRRAPTPRCPVLRTCQRAANERDGEQPVSERPHPRWQLRLERVGCTRLERVLHCGRAQQSRRPEIRCLLYLPLVPVSFRTVTDTSRVSSVLQVPSRINGCRHPVSDQTNLDASRWTQRRRRDAGVCAERYDGSVNAMRSVRDLVLGRQGCG